MNSGICTLYEYQDVAAEAEMPRRELIEIGVAWYWELEFASESIESSGQSDMVSIDNRIRILQNRFVSSQSVIALEDKKLYRTIRAFHGTDDYGRPITDISLKRIEEDYEET